MNNNGDKMKKLWNIFFFLLLDFINIKIQLLKLNITFNCSDTRLIHFFCIRYLNQNNLLHRIKHSYLVALLCNKPVLFIHK